MSTYVCMFLLSVQVDSAASKVMNDIAPATIHHCFSSGHSLTQFFARSFSFFSLSLITYFSRNPETVKLYLFSFNFKQMKNTFFMF